MGVDKRSLGRSGGTDAFSFMLAEKWPSSYGHEEVPGTHAPTALRTVNQAAPLWSLMRRCLPDSLAGGLLQPWVLVGR